MLALALLAGAAAAQEAARRGVRIAVVPQEVRATEGFDANASAGLFVGIRHFKDSAFAEVPYAVDDAVDLAHLFALELELIAPPKVVLSLAGEPQKPASRERLRALLAAGASRRSAAQSDIYQLLSDVGGTSGDRGLFVVALATHGFSDQGSDFLVASDSLRGWMTRTGVAVNEVFDVVARATAPRRLVLLDACRERLFPSRAVGGEAMSRSFADAVVRASGQVVLAGTTAGGYSYDDPDRGNGVFTAEVLDGLRGQAPADERSFITVRQLADFVDRRVVEWVRRHRPEHVALSHGIALTLDAVAMADLPLAVDLEAAERGRRLDAALDRLRQNIGGPLSGAMFDEMAAILRSPALPRDQWLAFIAEIEALDGAERLQRSLRDWFNEHRAVLRSGATLTAQSQGDFREREAEGTATLPQQSASPEAAAPSPPQGADKFNVFIQFSESTRSTAEAVRKLLEDAGFRIVAFDELREGRLSPQRSEIVFYSTQSREACENIRTLLVADLNITLPVVKSKYFGDEKSEFKVYINLLETAKIDSKALSPGTEWTDPILGMRFHYVPAGTFRMGSPEDEQGRYDDEKLHTVKLTRSYWMGETEVTKGQWRRLMGKVPFSFRSCGDECPVEQVNWWEAVTFANRLSERSGLETCYVFDCQGTPGEGDYYCKSGELREDCQGFRLPTEAEWERAARARSEAATYNGDLNIRGPCDIPELNDIAWYCGNSKRNTHPVGLKRANDWGLQDMLGNVWEWVEDAAEWQGGVVTSTYESDVEDPLSSRGSFRVLRGGGFAGGERDCRAALRYAGSPDIRNRIGFRVVRTAH